MAGLGQIEEFTKDFSAKREALSAEVRQLQQGLEAVRNHYLGRVKTLADDVAEAQALLHQAVKESPEAFVKPKTLVLSGVRVGFKKEKGRIVWEDDATVVKLIRRHFPDRVEDLIKTEERPLKTALAQLKGAELKKLGVEVEADTDAVVIKPTDTEIDKLVSALLKEGEKELQDVA